ncbi:unnamed protein product [Cylindrotheca closterium]|uniref:Uncharacterized protein n=1 Tax=Cylindrotheca closterium TaxID=2856 RepID=A0AAD2FX55_9STRA|nr:unnamed protein product [Cylindrotheca closterium]
MPDTYTAKPRGSHQHLKQNKRLRKCTRVTLWKDNWELESVGRALVSVVDPTAATDAEQAMSIEEAFDTVSVWKARAHSGEGLPHAVESTYHLAHVYWRDHHNHLNLNKISTTELRLSYSSAIVRTINGFADVLQQQRFVASSVSLLCSKLGIPAWVVDIRHESSHNALPSLGVLRLATSTLMDFLKSEYWIPMCDDWNIEDEVEVLESKSITENTIVKTTTVKNEEDKKLPIDYLLAYKACATSFFSLASTDDKTSKKGGKKSDSKEQTAESNLSFDPVFGDEGSDEDDWDDPVLGGINGKYIGTTSNRFSLLELPKSKNSKQNSKSDKKKKKKKKSNDNSRATPKKKPGEKYPMDHAKDFVTAVTPQEGFPAAIMFLVYGGIGGSPLGRGVLIPGSTSAFPATENGVLKSWKRYSPLVQVLGRVWPGFCTCLLVNLVDFVLCIEESMIEEQAQRNSDEPSIDPGSARKLFFLSAWIRLLLSQQYVSAVDPTYVVPKASSKKNGSIELTLAELSFIQKLGYPLNSIADRCSAQNGDPDLRTTSQDILQSLEEILGENRVPRFGLLIASPSTDPSPVEGPSLPSHLQLPTDSSDHDENSSVASQETCTSLDDGMEGARLPSSYETTENPVDEVGENASALVDGMSLAEMEALLSEQQSPARAIGMEDVNKQETKHPATPNIVSQEMPFGGDTTMGDASKRHEQPKRIAWTKCSSWDSCSLGTLPGHPT